MNIFLKKNGITCIVGILNLLFLAYFIIWIWYDQYHYDDWHFLWNAKEWGFWKFMYFNYMTHSGRIAYYVINYLNFKLIVLGIDFRVFPLVYLLLGYGISWFAVKDWSSNLNKMKIFMVVLLAYNLYVLTCIDMAVFTWICAISYYLYAPCMLLLLKYLNLGHLNKVQWCIFGLLIWFLGAGHEAVTPVLLVVLFVNGLYYWRNDGWNSIKVLWQNKRVRRIAYSALVLFLLWILVVVAPGNFARLTADVEIEGFHSPHSTLDIIRAHCSCIGVFSYFQIFYIPYYLVLFFLCAYCGEKDRTPFPYSKIRCSVLLSMGLLTYLAVSSTPMVIIYGGFGIQRLYTHIVYALILYVCIFGYVVGRGSNFNKLFGVLSICGIVLLGIVMVFNIKNDVPIMKQYSKSVDARLELLVRERGKGRTDDITVEKFESPNVTDVKYNILTNLGMNCSKPAIYYISDTDVLPNETEYHIRRALNLKFDFILSAD